MDWKPFYEVLSWSVPLAGLTLLIILWRLPDWIEKLVSKNSKSQTHVSVTFDPRMENVVTASAKDSEELEEVLRVARKHIAAMQTEPLDEE